VPNASDNSSDVNINLLILLAPFVSTDVSLQVQPTCHRFAAAYGLPRAKRALKAALRIRGQRQEIISCLNSSPQTGNHRGFNQFPARAAHFIIALGALMIAVEKLAFRSYPQPRSYDNSCCLTFSLMR
jgi:hypothetical protein